MSDLTSRAYELARKVFGVAKQTNPPEVDALIKAMQDLGWPKPIVAQLELNSRARLIVNWQSKRASARYDAGLGWVDIWGPSGVFCQYHPEDERYDGPMSAKAAVGYLLRYQRPNEISWIAADGELINMPAIGAEPATLP